MRILSILALSVMAFAATAQNYTITGKADAKYDGKNIYLIDQATMAPVDTAVVAGGAFSFKGNAADQHLYEINVNGNKRMRTYVMVTPETDAVVDFTARPASVTGGLNDKRT